MLIADIKQFCFANLVRITCLPVTEIHPKNKKKHFFINNMAKPLADALY